MTVYGIDRETTLVQRELIRRYGDLNAGQDQPHGRGQRFNRLVADVLRYWDVEDVEDGIRGVEGSDEIDVAFTLEGTPYLLEAKWHAEPVSDDPPAKLLRRIRRRLGGTRGIVLSMSGFTRHAVESADRGAQPEILLLERSHFEAMLSGLLSPQDLLTALVRLVSRRGGVRAPMTALLPVHNNPVPELATVPPAELPWEVVSETAGGIGAQPVFVGVGDWPEPTGMEAGPDSDLLITTPDGIISVSLADGSTRWVLPLMGCRGTALADPDGGLMTVCNYAVVRWRDEAPQLLGGGFTGNSTLLLGPGGQPWVYDNTGANSADLLTLTRIGNRLGDQESHEIGFPARVWGAAWLDRRRFFLASDGHSAVTDLDEDGGHVSREAWIESPQSGPRPTLVRDGDTVVTAARVQAGVRGNIYQMNVSSGARGQLAELAVNWIHGLTGFPDGSAYLLADVRGNSSYPHPVIIRVDGLGPFRVWS